MGLENVCNALVTSRKILLKLNTISISKCVLIYIQVLLMIRSIFLFVLLLTSTLCISQEGYVHEDEIYESNIKSVKFHLEGLFTAMPIIDLNSDALLVLTFDDINGGDRDLAYKLIHCDKDWQPSDITEMDFLEGFNDEEIQNVFYSIGTKVDYTNYELVLPNRDTRWRASGNYIVLVYDEETLAPILTRRFLVAENKVTVSPSMSNPIDVTKLKTHQEINFSIIHNNFEIRRPLQTIHATIMQNGRWDNMITNIQPKFNTPGKLHFDRTQRISFDSYKEFRSFDIRSTRDINYTIHSVDITVPRIDVLLQLHKERIGQNIFSETIYGNSRRDINGDYIIETLDRNDSYTQAEYVNTFFNFQPRISYPEREIYIFGKLTDWKIKEEFKLTYDPRRELFRTNLLLKQGYYDFIYVEVEEDGTMVNTFEGSWYETENDYTIIIYHRSFSDRYDRIIAVRTFNSLNR